MNARDELERVFSDQNPWHSAGAVPAVLAPPVQRPLARSLAGCLERDSPHRFQLILGPRRVGKSTAMYQTVSRLLNRGLDRRRLWWLRLDHPLLLQEQLGTLVRTILAHQPSSGSGDAYLFLDELVYARDWDLWLKTFYDDRWPVRIVATSSATAALAERRTESGVGRWNSLYLAPYTFWEFVALAGHEVAVPATDGLADALAATAGAITQPSLLADLRQRLMLIGGFPELLITEQQARVDDLESRVLRSQRTLRSDAIDRAIYKDIPQSFRIDNPMLLERLLYVLAGQIAGRLQPSSICRDMDGLAIPTFERYLSYLERAFLVFTLPNYSGSEAATQKRGRVLYFVDTAVRNAALQRGTSPLQNPAELGHLTENMAATNLRALAEQSGARLYHWRDGRDEVDLIYDHPAEAMAFEIGLSPDHSRRGLRALAHAHPRFRGRCWLVTPDAPYRPPTENHDIGTVSLDAFLLAVGSVAERHLRANLGAHTDTLF